MSGSYYINQSGLASQGLRLDLTGVTISGDTTIISNVPIFANGLEDSAGDAIFTLVSTYQPPTGSACDVNQDNSECSIHLKNNFEPSGNTAVVIYSPVRSGRGQEQPGSVRNDLRGRDPDQEQPNPDLRLPRRARGRVRRRHLRGRDLDRAGALALHAQPGRRAPAVASRRWKRSRSHSPVSGGSSSAASSTSSCTVSRDKNRSSGPASRCPSCGHELSAVDNIPVVSWLLLNGRCRYCRAPDLRSLPGRRAPDRGRLDARRPSSRPARAAGNHANGQDWQLLAFLPFLWVLVALSLIDLEHKILPNKIVYPSVVLGVPLLGDHRGDWAPASTPGCGRCSAASPAPEGSSSSRSSRRPGWGWGT